MTFRLLTDLTAKPELKQVPDQFVIFLEHDGNVEYLGLPNGWSHPEPEELVDSGRWGSRDPSSGQPVIFPFASHEGAMTVVEAMIKTFSERKHHGPAVKRIFQLVDAGKPYRFGVRGVMMHEFEVVAYGQ